MVNPQPIRFVVVGDVTLDVTVRGPATATPGADRPAHITLAPGGQGANLAVRLARRGAGVDLVTALADDLPGQQMRYALAVDGVTLVPLPAARSGIVVSLVDGAGERAMLSDRVSFDAEALASPAVHAALDSASWIHISGYPLADSRSGGALAGLVASRRAGQVCSVGGGSFAGGNGLLSRLRLTRPDLVLVDRSEASAILAAGSVAGRLRTAEELAAGLVSALGGVAVVTDGAEGSAAAIGAQTLTMPSTPGVAVDATGAGDAHAAGFLLAVAEGPWPPSSATLHDALEQGGRLGAEVAGVVGAQARVPSEESQ
ncbi:MAG: carbohydrate kinase family protein [Candidatus Limnocylindria bacterium]